MRSDRAFTVADAHARGLTRSDLRAPELRIPTRGARVAESAGDDRDDLVEALRALARDDQFFSHSTAARVHGIALPWRLRDDVVHLASPSFTSRTVRAGVQGHRIKAEVVEIAGLRVESIADTLIHLGAMLSVDELVVACESVVRSRADVEALAARALHFKGSRGHGTVRRALGRVRLGAESPAETRTRLLITDSGLPEPSAQHVVRDGSGAFVGRLDLSWPELLLAVEYDGQLHRLDSVQYAVDLERHRRLQELGWLVIRVTKEDLRDGGGRILGVIRTAYEARREP